MKPFVSIIVPVYKVEPWLDRCVASVLAQTFREFELLLVDDGSPDRCGEMCEDWAKRDARIRVFHKPNGGLSDARNFALERLQGEFVVFADSDDWLEPGCLAYLMDLQRRHPGCLYYEASFSVLRGGRLHPRDTSGAVERLGRKEAFQRLLYDDRLYQSACAKLFPRKTFDDFRFPIGKVYEDTHLIVHCLSQDGEIAYGAMPQYVYAIRDDSITTSRFDPANCRDHLTAMRLLADTATGAFPELANGARRLLAFSRLRTLRQMRGIPPEHRPLANRLRSEVLADAAALLADPMLPRRDRLGIRCLRVGLPFYHFAWSVYCRLRDL